MCHTGLNVLTGTAPAGVMKMPSTLALIFHTTFLKKMYGDVECTLIQVTHFFLL